MFLFHNINSEKDQACVNIYFKYDVDRSAKCFWILLHIIFGGNRLWKPVGVIIKRNLFGFKSVFRLFRIHDRVTIQIGDNSSASGRCGSNFKSIISKCIILNSIWGTVILLSGECGRSLTIWSQHRFRQLLVAWRQQAINSTNDD